VLFPAEMLGFTGNLLFGPASKKNKTKQDIDQ
jgi:hypothetical protein